MKIKLTLLFLVISISLLIAPIYAVVTGNCGLEDVYSYIDGEDSYLVVIDCVECERYTVEPAGKDDQIPIGEGRVPVNEELGEYMVKILLLDSGVNESFKEKYEPHVTYTLDGSGGRLRFMWYYTLEQRRIHKALSHDQPESQALRRK